MQSNAQRTLTVVIYESRLAAQFDYCIQRRLSAVSEVAERPVICEWRRAHRRRRVEWIALSDGNDEGRSGRLGVSTECSPCRLVASSLAHCSTASEHGAESSSHQTSRPSVSCIMDDDVAWRCRCGVASLHCVLASTARRGRRICGPMSVAVG